MQPFSTLSNVYFVCVQINDRQSLCERHNWRSLNSQMENSMQCAHTLNIASLGMHLFTRTKRRTFFIFFRTCFDFSQRIVSMLYFSLMDKCHAKFNKRKVNLIKCINIRMGLLKPEFLSQSQVALFYTELLWTITIHQWLTRSLALSLFLFSLFHSLPLHHNKKKCHRHVLRHLKRWMKSLGE